MRQPRTCWRIGGQPHAKPLARPRVKHHQAPRTSRPYVYTVGTRLGRKVYTANKTPAVRTYRHGRPPAVYTYGPFVYTVGTRSGRKVYTVRAVLAGAAKKRAR